MALDFKGCADRLRKAAEREAGDGLADIALAIGLSEASTAREVEAALAGLIDGGFGRQPADSDGEPVSDGDVLYSVSDMRKVTVKQVCSYRCALALSDDGRDILIDPRDYSHAPTDSWGRIEDDSTMHPDIYCMRRGLYDRDGARPHTTIELFARDLVRRARELASWEASRR